MFFFQGTFRNLGRVRIRPFLKNQAVIEENENLYGDGEPEDERGVHPLQHVLQFE